MASYSHLSAAHRADARNQIVKDARILIQRNARIWYTQGAPRWNCIAHNLSPYEVSTGDCSSIATYLLWRALRNRVSRDIVNGAGWKGGFTGTQRQHGKLVRDRSDKSTKVGDLAHYGGGTGRHVTIKVGPGRWLSHGSNRGPLLVPLHYRSDLQMIRRYI